MTVPEPSAPIADLPGWAGEARAGVLTALGLVLLSAPVGLLWAAVAPPVEVVVSAGGATQLAEPANDGFIAVDGVFLALVVLAGGLSAVLAWRLSGRGARPGVGIGLAVGGLLAAEVARRTGQLVDDGQAQALVDAGREGVVSLSVRLRAESARAGWPVAALAVHLVLVLLTTRPDAPPVRPEADLSSG